MREREREREKLKVTGFRDLEFPLALLKQIAITSLRFHVEHWGWSHLKAIKMLYNVY